MVITLDSPLELVTVMVLALGLKLDGSPEAFSKVTCDEENEVAKVTLSGWTVKLSVSAPE